MLRNILQAVLLAIILTSCQREVSIIQRQNDDPLLIKTISVSTAGNDSMIITYDYDNTDRLVKETFYNKYHTPAGDMVLPVGFEYTRDGRGRITRIKGTGRSPMNPTTEIIGFGNVVYVNDTSTRVAYVIDDNGSSKTLFIYDNVGKILRTETYQHFPLPTDPMRIVIYNLHQYDAAGNLTEKTQFSDTDNNGSLEQAITYRFEYDEKINPVDHRDDALFENRWSAMSPHNCTKQLNDYSNLGSSDDFIAEQYSYRNDGRPQSSVVTGTAREHYIRTYFYQ